MHAPPPQYSPPSSRLAMKSSAKRPNKINNRSQQCNSPKPQCIVQNQEERLKKLQHQICRSFWDSSFRCIHLKNMAMLDQLAFFAAVQKLCPLMAIWMYAFLIEHECPTPQRAPTTSSCASRWACEVQLDVLLYC